MAEIAIWNLALGRTGDDATVASPTERSRQAELCRQFYAIARDSLLEMHDWNFATRRVLLAPVAVDAWVNWNYAYACPANAVRVFQVGDSAAISAYEHTDDALRVPIRTPAALAPRQADQFEIEIDAAEDRVIYSNVPDALARFTVRVENTDRFSPLFRDALGWLLASYLAGPILKGETGRAEAQRLLGVFEAFMAKAAGSDSRQARRTDYRETHTASWMAAR